LNRRAFIKLTSLLAAVQPVAAASKEVCSTQIEQIEALLNQAQPATWVFTGDSVTHGVLHTRGARSYPELVAESIRFTRGRYLDAVINSGVNGTTTSYLRGHFNWLVERYNPQVVWMMFGLNDCQDPSIPPRVFADNLNWFTEKIRAQKGIPILQSPNSVDHAGIAQMKTASRERLAEYVQVIEAVATQTNTIYLDHYHQWESKGLETMKTWLDDPFHPNALGHTIIAKKICNELNISKEL
jgi:acyl-CoA thioesterase-1